LKEYEEGRLTLWQAAKKSGITLWEMVEEKKKSVAHTPYSFDDVREDLEAL